VRTLFLHIEKFDRKVSEYLALSRKPWLKKSLALVTHLGDGIFWLIAYLCMFFFFYESLGQMLHTLLSAEIMGLFIVIPLRYVTKRERPAVQYPPKIAWNKYSFPSHHSLRSFFIATIISTYCKNLFFFLFSGAVAVSFSRIYLSRHYLSDVLAGMLIGLFTAAISLSLVFIEQALV